MNSPLRIFYAADDSPNPDFASRLWRTNLHDSLVDLGHEVIDFDYDLAETFRHLDPEQSDHLAFIQQNRPRLTVALLKQIHQAHRERPIDLFFSYFYDACVLPEAIDEIRALGIKTVNWFCNGSFQLHLVREISPHYDWCLVPEQFRLQDYTAMGARPIYCQEAANPKKYQPRTVSQDYDVTFVGQCYGDRPDYIRHLLHSGIPVRVWGARWDYLREPVPARNPLRRCAGIVKRAWFKSSGPAADGTRYLPAHLVGGVLSDDAMITLYSRSKINLGFSSCGETHRHRERIVQVRLRDFEVPMCGGFYLVEQMEELEAFFEPDREIVCYRSQRRTGGQDQVLSPPRNCPRNDPPGRPRTLPTRSHLAKTLRSRVCPDGARMMPPQVSIIMPVYNAERYMAAAVNSLLAQTFNDFELILVDDASSDGSWSAASWFNDVRIRRFRNSHNRGAAATRNCGLRAARANYIAFLDSDDMALPARLEQQVTFLGAHPSVSVVGSQVEVLGCDFTENPKLRRRAEEIPATLLFENCLAQSTVMLRKSSLPADPFDSEFEPAEDYHLWARLAPGAAFFNLEKTLVQYRHHPQSISHSAAARMQQSIRGIAALQLERLGISSPDLELHVSLSEWPVLPERQQLRRAETWLRELQQANQARAIYAPDVFARILAERWCAVCCASWQLGLWAWLTFWHSPLSRLHPAPIVPLLRLLRHALPQTIRGRRR